MTNIKTIVEGDRTIIKYSGVLDTKRAPELTKILDEVTTRECDVVLDFSELDYILSAGIRSLLFACKKLKSKDRLLEITGASQEVVDVLSMTGVDRVSRIR